MAGLVICLTHIGEEMLKTLLFCGMGVLVKWTDQPPQTAQIWNYLPPQTKNSSESATSRLISAVKQSSDFTVAQFASTSDRHAFNSFASTDTLTDRKSMTQRSNYPAQTPQILNDWATRAKNSCESTTSPLISQLSGSQIFNY